MLCTGLIMEKYQSHTYFQDPCRPPLQMTDAFKHIPNWASTRENLSSGACKQHRRRPACTSAQSDQRLCYSLFEKYHMKSCYRWNFNLPASLCSWGYWFETRFVGNPEDRFSREGAQLKLKINQPAALWVIRFLPNYNSQVINYHPKGNK